MSLPFPKLTPEELLSNCYQCGKCTAGCPVAARMDITPNQLIRTVQLGQTAAALRSQAIWECVSCQTCSTRCPKKVDCAAVMDGLREISLAEGMVAASQQPTVSFQQAFLDNIRRNGRLVELELIAHFKTTVFFRTTLAEIIAFSLVLFHLGPITSEPQG